MFIQPNEPGYIIHCRKHAEWKELLGYLVRDTDMTYTQYEFYLNDFSTDCEYDGHSDSIRITFSGNSIEGYGRGNLGFYQTQSIYSGYTIIEFCDLNPDELVPGVTEDTISTMFELL